MVQHLSCSLSHSQVGKRTCTSQAATSSLLHLQTLDLFKRDKFLSPGPFSIKSRQECSSTAGNPLLNLLKGGYDNRDITSHMRPDSSVECSQCGKIFHGEYCKYNLKKHMTIHAGVKPYTCSLCSRTFNQKSSMRRHVSMVHCLHPDTMAPLGPSDSHVVSAFGDVNAMQRGGSADDIATESTSPQDIEPLELHPGVSHEHRFRNERNVSSVIEDSHEQSFDDVES